MDIFQFLVSAAVLSFVAGIFVVVGAALIVGSFLGRKFKRESRTLARYGVGVLLCGVIGTLWTPLIGALLAALIVWGLVQCFT